MPRLTPIRLKAPSIRETGQIMSENSDAKQRLLIVDDSKVIRVTARKILQNHFETVEAVDGENAWEILSGMGPFSLIISDLTMPKLDGYGLLEKIRAAHDPHVCNVPVIVITGDNDSESTMQRAREAGATDFIGKPFDAVHLLARAQSHASAHDAQQSLAEQKLELEEQVPVDAQTGLPNEAAFMERGKQQLSYASRHGTRLAVAQVEIDNYGALYRQHGDPAAEAMVKHVAGVLEAGTREEDMAARIGTARFAILLAGMEPTGVQTLADRIGKNVSGHVIRDGDEEISFTVSIGICIQDIQSDTRFYDLLTTAGNKLQVAMKEGGNRVAFDNYQGISNQPAEGPVAEAVPDNSSADNEDGPDASPVISDATVDTRQQTVTDAATEEATLVIADAVAGEETDSTVEQPVPEVETAPANTEEELPEIFAESIAGGSKKLASKVARAKKLAAADNEDTFNFTHGESADITAADSNTEQTVTSAPTTAQVTGTQRKGFFSRIFSIFRRSGK